MKATRFVAKNTALLTFGLFAGRILALFIFRRIADIGAEDTGMWGTAIDITAILTVVANFGLGTLITREIVRRAEMTLSVFLAALRIRITLGLGCYAILIAYVFMSGFDQPTRIATLIMALGVILETTGMTCDAVLQAHEKVQFQTGSQIVSAIVYFGLSWIWLDMGYGLIGVIWANVISRAARLSVIIPLMLKHTGPWEKPASGDYSIKARQLARMGLPLFLSTTFGIISYKIDTVMLFEMLGKTAAGIYTLGHRALDVLLIIPSLFATALFPSMARFGDNKTDISRMGERALRYLHLIIFPIAMLCVVSAKPVIEWVSKEPGFEPSILVFQVVIWGLPIQAANHIYNRLLISMGKEDLFIKISIVAMVTNVGLNLILIPKYQWYGAAGTTLISLSLSMLMHRYFVVQGGIELPWKRTAIGGSLTMLTAWFATSAIIQKLIPVWGCGWLALPTYSWLAYIVTVLITGLLYGVLVIAVGVLRKKDLSLLKELKG
jgi:O-antigen/teichoic acid export membrane protein